MPAGTHAPTALTCAPGSSHAFCNTGSAELVAVTTIPAPATASAAEAQAVTGTAVRSRMSSANRRALSGSRPVTRTRSSGRTAAIASRCDRACTPVPMMASSAASARASSSVATADTAAVRISVTADALSSASGSPVCALDSSTTPWCESRPLAGLPPKMQIAFRP